MSDGIIRGLECGPKEFRDGFKSLGWRPKMNGREALTDTAKSILQELKTHELDRLFQRKSSSNAEARAYMDFRHTILSSFLFDEF